MEEKQVFFFFFFKFQVVEKASVDAGLILVPLVCSLQYWT